MPKPKARPRPSDEPPAQPHQPGQPWTLAEAANYLRLGLRTLTQMEKDGRIRFSRPTPGRVLVPDSEVRRIADGVAAN